MTTDDISTLTLLSNSELTVADGCEDIRRRTVREKDGTEVGTVDDLLIHEDNRQVHFMRVESGGFLGMGETKVFIPLGAITMITDIDVWINQVDEHVSREPRYDPMLVNHQH